MSNNIKITQYFAHNRIPFNYNGLNKMWYSSNNSKYGSKNKIREHFIIPGKIIFLVTYSTMTHMDGHCRLEKLLRLLKSHNIEESLYFLIYDKPVDSKEISQNHFSENGIPLFGFDITITTDISSITPVEFIYYISTNGPLYSIVISEDVTALQKLQAPIYVDKRTYLNSCVYMTPDEQERLKRIPYTIIDSEPDVKYHIQFLNKIPNGHKFDYIHHFIYQMKYKPLSDGTRKPLQHIPTITDYCVKCNNLFRMDHIDDNKICIICNKK